MWADDWQMQCCGEPFRVGSEVAWTLGEADRDWLEEMLGQVVTAGTDLRLVLPCSHVLRVMKMQGVGAVPPIYCNVDEALSGMAVTTGGTLGPPFAHG